MSVRQSRAQHEQGALSTVHESIGYYMHFDLAIAVVLR
jgi:hypothetical protein